MNGQRYQELLKDEVIPECKRLYPQANFVYQQDGAPAHKAIKTQELLEEIAPGYITFKEWPAMSPDLNPLDYRLWAWMEERIYANGNPHNLEELIQRIEDAWNSLSKTTIQGWIREFKQRLRRCIEEDGRHVQQFFNKH